MSKHCLVTGGSGFIGQHLLALLTQRGHPVSVLMRRPHSLPALREQVEKLGGRGDLVSAVAGDLGLPGLGLSATAREQVRHAAVVFHLGAQFAWGLSLEQARQVNVGGALSVAELAAEQGSLLLMVGGFMLANHGHLQRIGIDLKRPEHTDWDKVYKRTGSYEGSKLEAHFRVRELMAKLQAPQVVVHPATVCGHSRSGHILPAQPLAVLIKSLAAGQLGAIPGSAAHWLPLVSVDFLVQLMVAAAFDELQVEQEILALDSATPNLQAMLQQLACTLNVRSPSWYVPIPLLRALLRVPGMPRLLHTDAESLDFIQTTRFDTDATRALAQRHQLHWPDIGQALHATARYLACKPSAT